MEVWEIALEKIEEYVKAKKLQSRLLKVGICIAECDKGQFALEVPRGGRSKKAATFWFSFPPKAPLGVNVKPYPAGKGRYGKLKNTAMNDSVDAWSIMVDQPQEQSNNIINDILLDLTGKSPADAQAQPSSIANAKIGDQNTDERASSSVDLPSAGENNAVQVRDFDEIARKIDEECANLEGQDVDAVVKRRVGQGVFRDLLLKRFDSACCMTGLKNARLLIASHIVPWSESEPTQKLDPNNGLLLSVSMDALFDKGLISFSDNGSILIKDDLDAETIEILGLKTQFALPDKLLTDERKENLTKHRELHGFNVSL